MRDCLVGIAALAAAIATAAVRAEGEEMSAIRMPGFSELTPRKELPDPLRCLDGTKVTSAEEWHRKRKPEVRELFRHFVYGHTPPAPGNLRHVLDREEKRYFGGKATLKELALTFGPPGTPPIHLLLVVPNRRRGPAPVILAVSFRGNHTVLDDPKIRLSAGWVYRRSKGVVKNRATEASRGTCKDRWPVERAVDRGYAVATFHSSDVDPDHNDFDDGVHKAYRDAGESYDWGTIAAWAWGLHRAVDYLRRDDDIDGERIVVMGHSRLGKTALLAGAMDERVAAVISNNSGCTGAALSRRRKGETVRRINRSFPHWFNRNYKRFDDKEDLLPVDQHMLIALIAPRPVLVNSGEKDAWADPEGEFLAAAGADPVYRLLGTDGLKTDRMPPKDTLVKSRIGYHLRSGGHGVSKVDWNVFMDFLDHHFRGRG